jgi:hypothetical protein
MPCAHPWHYSPVPCSVGSGFARVTNERAATLPTRSAKTTHMTIRGTRIQYRPEQIGQCALRHSCLTQSRILRLYQPSSGRRSDYPHFRNLANTAPSGLLKATGRHSASYRHGCFVLRTGSPRRRENADSPCDLTIRRLRALPPWGAFALRLFDGVSRENPAGAASKR